MDKTDNRFYREAGADSIDLPGDNARDRIIEKMARAMNIATDGHDRYWSGYVKSATAAHKVVADHLAITRPASQPKVLTDEQIARTLWAIRREEEDRCDMELEDMGTDHSVWREAAAISALLESAK